MADEVDNLFPILDKEAYAAMDCWMPTDPVDKMMLGSSLTTWIVSWMMRYPPMLEFMRWKCQEEDRWDNWCTHWSYMPTCSPCTNRWWKWCSCWVWSSAQTDSCHSRWWHWAMEGASWGQLRQGCLTSTGDLLYTLCHWVWSCCSGCWQKPSMQYRSPINLESNHRSIPHSARIVHTSTHLGMDNCPAQESVCKGCLKKGHWQAKSHSSKKYQSTAPVDIQSKGMPGQHRKKGKKVDLIGVHTKEPPHDEIFLDDVHAPHIMRHIQLFTYLLLLAAREWPHSESKLTLG